MRPVCTRVRRRQTYDAGNGRFSAGTGCGRHRAGLSVFAQKAETSHHLSRTVVSDRAGSRRIYRSDSDFCGCGQSSASRVVKTEEGRIIIKELDVVKLVKDFNGLPTGTEGTIVLEYDGTAYEVELVDSEGETIDVLTTPVDMIALVDHP